MHNVRLIMCTPRSKHILVAFRFIATCGGLLQQAMPVLACSS